MLNTTDLSALIDRVPVGVIVVDEEGRLLLMNAMGREISGAAPDDSLAVADQSDQYALREPRTGRALAPCETPIARALAGETLHNFEYTFRPPGCTRDRWVRCVAFPRLDDAGRRIGAVAMFEDVTEERLLDQAREDFLYTAVHDLKTPLTGMKGFTQLLARRLARGGTVEPEALRGHLAQTIERVERMEEILHGLLDLARLQAGEQLDLTLAQVDLVALIRNVVEQCAEISDCHPVHLRAGASPIVGTWDKQRLRRVVENLIVNAITYSPDGGEIAVGIERQNDDDGAWAVVGIRDRGLGIPARDLPRIFERFYRGSNVVGRFQGSGIGLAGVKQIVEQHGGRVAVQSREGEGTTLSLWLPLDK